MKAIYAVPAHPCPPDWGIMLYLLNAPIVADKRKKCSLPSCNNEFRSTNRQHKKEFCCDACEQKARTAKAKARRATSTHRLSEAPAHATGARRLHPSKV